ncbi:Uncharacterized protein BM_BM17195 [Brugia malayi]|uniref:Guanylate kinase-like domain-containing protein n=1 Tax=Brugia malayi TaxID=6279 RepID=A0A4E9FSD0_BRUMA|nr:Uncharacterized protein BM_BM17195 [Brugia malayi]VIP00290.1 Uncharacterized protein BM_BM17195 [Brugia malayi]
MLQRLLRDACGAVTFKIVPFYRNAPPACEIFVRAQFDYDPGEDDLIPYSQAALGNGSSSGTTGALVAGLIPSLELQKWRIAYLAMEQARDNSYLIILNVNDEFLFSSLYVAQQEEKILHNQMVRLAAYRHKTLVLLDARGVGRRHIKNTLIHRHPQRFDYPIPHTTRQRN